MNNIRHVGLVVSDIQRSLEFYQNLLGLKIKGQTDEKGNFISTILNHQDIQVKTVKLSADDNATRLELLEFKNVSQNFVHKTTLFNSGFTHISLTVSNLDDLYVRLKNSDVEFVSAPQLSENKALKVVFCKDFEGNYLELIEELDTKK
ncbi:Metallothiol transferase FosB protein [Marine Group I thaumarchaeote SCGC AAA799-B03]|uniref:Metallothiol transferase FosB protein n=1 Tax=Marine Group I thaumarchaeote SCGC AAA799-B03 TaxID=1502289 RepID=A0A087S8T8_9ARCH|nr:Metallothiol transferase FosB protein [Marine Group I thaumarchaeote SCGC AAA799-B03]